MSAKANYFKIGIFVISAVIVAVIAAVIFGAGALFREKIPLETYIDGSVQGLDVGSPVKFRGVKIGNVKEITFVDQEYNLDLTAEDFFKYGRYVLVKIDLESMRDFRSMHDKDIRQFMRKQIERGLRIRMASQGLTGAAYLEVDYLDLAWNPPLAITWEPISYYVPSARSTITQFTESVDKILKNLEEINILGITVSLEKSLNVVAQMVEDVNVAEVREKVVQLFTEARETNKQIGPFLSNASTSLESIKRLVEDSEKPLKQTLAAMQDIPEIFDYLKLILRRMDKVVYSQQHDIERAMENISLITDDIRELTGNARKYPSQLLFGEPPPRSKPEGVQ